MDDAGFDEYVRARGAHLLRIAFLLTRDHAHAEDLVQTALVRSWSAWRRIAGDPEPYVRKVLVNTYASWRGRRWHGERPSDVLPEVACAAPQTAVEERDAVWRALGRLAPRQRAVVVLRYVEDLSEAQTADALDISTGAVKAHAARALANLRLDEELRASTFPEPEVVHDRLAAVHGRITRRRTRRVASAVVAALAVIAVVITVMAAAGVRVHAAPVPAQFRVGTFYMGDRVLASAIAPANGTATITYTPTSEDEHIMYDCVSSQPMTRNTWLMAVYANGTVINAGLGCEDFTSVGFMSYRPPADSLGRPLTLTIARYVEPNKADPGPMPAGARMIAAVTQAVPFASYPDKGCRPHSPLAPADMSNLHGREPIAILGPDHRSATIPAGTYDLLEYSQTPGWFDIKRDGAAFPTIKVVNCDGLGETEYDGWDIGKSGGTGTVSVTATYATGVWFVLIVQ